jgi:signal transduction histidine kinase
VDHFDTVRRRKDGSEVAISLTVSPIRTDDGTIIGASKIARDVSERKAAEEAIRQSMEIKDQFLSLVSHELRTPIATIRGNSRLLVRREEMLAAEDRRQALRDIASESERLEGMIENLLVLTRLGSDHLVLEPTQVAAVVNAAVHSFRTKFPERQIDVDVARELPPILGHPQLLQLVIDNLLSNANKYSPSDELIEVTAREAPDGFLNVTVNDRGIGLRPEEMENVFAPFFRTDAARSRAPGLGLGLGVCRRVIHEHGGTLELGARPGGGLSVFLTIPFATSEY